MKKVKISELTRVSSLTGAEIVPFAKDGSNGAVTTAKLKEYAQPDLSAITTALGGKVDKVTGKGLSANDYTNDDKATLTALGALLSYPEDVFSYGVQFDTSISSPSCTRVGNVALHKTLPIQSRMRGCLLDDDGQVVEYLDPRDWTGQVRDGSRGQVMVEIPMHYRKFETNGTTRVVRLSEYPISGYHQVPKMYVSAYEASIERSTGKLCSVVNDGADYRGGNNNANYDGTYRSLLGRPVTSINRTAFRSAARKRKSGSSEWNCYLYQVHKALFWLFTVEYAQLNSQEDYNSELTSEGFRQGGLGAGVSDWSNLDWLTFNGQYPFVPCGHTDTLGNSTGVVAYTAYNADGSEFKTSNVPRYRGVENPFGHIFKWTDGINVRISPTEANGGDNLSKVFVCEDPSKLNDTNYNGYKHVGNEARTNGFVKEIIFGEEGEIMPSLVEGGSTQFFCDYHWTNIPTTEALRGVMFGGYAIYNAYDGLAYAHSVYAPSNSQTNVGSRLCFIPAKLDKSEWDEEHGQFTVVDKYINIEGGLARTEWARATEFICLNHKYDIKTDAKSIVDTVYVITFYDSTGKRIKGYRTQDLTYGEDGFATLTPSEFPTGAAYIRLSCYAAPFSGFTWSNGPSIEAREGGVSEAIQASLTAAVDEALIAEATAAGAVFNRNSGYFELNTLTDITAPQMRTIMAAGARQSSTLNWAYVMSTIRTHLPRVGEGQAANAVATFRTCYFLEAVEMPNLRLQGEVFFGCNRLRSVNLKRQPIYDLNNAAMANFQGCSKLVELRGCLRSNFGFNIADSPLLSLASFQYMVDKAYNTAPITITVHPDVYAKIQDETNTEWHALLAAATAKQITFATTE